MSASGRQFRSFKALQLPDVDISEVASMCRWHTLRTAIFQSSIECFFLASAITFHILRGGAAIPGLGAGGGDPLSDTGEPRG